MRRFERIDVPRARDAVLPKRATAYSAGYDFVARMISSSMRAGVSLRR